jgi:hypothetical protein
MPTELAEHKKERRQTNTIKYNQITRKETEIYKSQEQQEQVLLD